MGPVVAVREEDDEGWKRRKEEGEKHFLFCGKNWIKKREEGIEGD